MQSEKKGKRIRPLLTTLCTTAAGEDWEKAIHAACAIELIHNFSLIHDDIEDNGETRRGKPAVWTRWGLAKGINAGDAMFAAAFAVMCSQTELTPQQSNACTRLLAQTCIALTEGQQLDIGYETRESITIDNYMQMIKRKTAALISCCTEMGALIGGLGENDRNLFRSFGENLGIAFQILDDWLGIWGDPTVTGKSVCSDLLEKKKSYPVILGMHKSKRFHEKWILGNSTLDEIPIIADWLVKVGIQDEVEGEIRKWTDLALDDINKIRCEEEIKAGLKELTNKLLIREY
ncbi:MAG: polyprenyl synthetase family protein [Chloroflexi bacterium]|nr:polyprenyl synthetase family protein [Chloroflexota bacterium]